jgi:hypothetical protein
LSPSPLSDKTTARSILGFSAVFPTPKNTLRKNKYKIWVLHK